MHLEAVAMTRVADLEALVAEKSEALATAATVGKMILEKNQERSLALACIACLTASSDVYVQALARELQSHKESQSHATEEARQKSVSHHLTSYLPFRFRGWRTSFRSAKTQLTRERERPVHS